MDKKPLLFGIIGGVIIAFVSGLISSTPPMLVGAVHYGYPLAWRFRLIIAPQYYPWRFDMLNLSLDIIIWVIIVYFILLALIKVRKPAGKTSP